MYYNNQGQLPETTQTDVTTPVTLNMIQSFRYVDDETRAMLVRHPSLIARIFPTAKQRMINEIQNNALQLNGQMYLESVRTIGQFQIQALQEELRDRLMRGAATIRTETIKVAQEKLVEVSAELSRNQQRLIKQLENDLEFCKNIKSNFLRKKYEEAIVKHTDEVFDTFDRLSSHFKNFLDLRIGSAPVGNVPAQNALPR